MGVNMTGKRLGWGVIGASKIASEWLIPAINAAADSEVVAVLSSDAGRAEAFARANGIGAHYADAKAFLADPNVDVVYVSTTNERHVRDTLSAAAAGKHILCEKPMALTADDARSMLDACEKAAVVLGVNHHMRCMETHRAIREIVQAGTLGNIVLARVFFGVELPEDAKRWRAHDASIGAGVIFDLTVHDMDLLRFMFDDEIGSVVCLTGTTGSTSAGIEDTTMLVVKMKSGLLVEVVESFNTPHAHTGLEIHGTKGSLIAEDVLLQNGGGNVFIEAGGDRKQVPIDTVSPYLRVVRDFNAAVKGEGKPAASGIDGYKALVAALCAQESSNTGRVVDIPQ
jgi:1,5-anhydro-D-fructose reductase (1,5-anhydro-D-mannitol-forming)